MKKAILLPFLFLTAIASAVPLQFTHNGTQTFVTPLQDPTDYCYPPQGQPFASYFTDNKCYYRFNNDCKSAAIVQYMPGNEQNNKNFFTLCSQPASQLGPQIILHVAPGAVNGNFQVNSCLLLPNRSSTDIHQAQFNVFFDTNGTPDPTISVPGCPPNNIGILNLPTSSKLNQNVNVQMICQDILTRAEVTRTASINPSALSYEECPASS